jgi:sulfur carrier protein
MDVTVNGKRRDVGEGSTVAQLIEALGYGQRQVVVERNGEPVERARFDEIALQEGDKVEVVRAVAGGQDAPTGAPSR